MATFDTPIVRLDDVKEHPNADRLELAHVRDFQCVVQKGKFERGDLVAYIREASLVPQWLLKRLGLEGKLAGSNKNRVKAVRLRGQLSQGVVLPVKQAHVPLIQQPDYGWIEREDGKKYTVALGDDVSDVLGIEKYEPPIPVHMAGEVFNAHGRTVRYDIENFKNYPNVIQQGEPVIMTEKLHGTWCCIGVVPDQQAHEDAGRWIITSKGLSAKGLAFKLNEKNENNLYVRAMRQHASDIDKRVDDDQYLYILGEVFGGGVQDLHYGIAKNDNDVGFRVFDMYSGRPGHGHYLNYDELKAKCEDFELDMVPVLYEGPFSKAQMKHLTDGPETISGNQSHIREGIVIRPQIEKRDPNLGRIQLKSVSEDYLTRKDGTEYN